MYIHFGKVWKSEFKAKKLKQISDAFAFASGMSKMDWERVDYSSLDTGAANQHFNKFVRPETDKRDNFVGVQPKQIKKFLKVYSIEELSFMLSYLSVEDCMQFIDTDNCVNWKRAWELRVFEQLTDKYALSLEQIKINMFRKYIEDEISDEDIAKLPTEFFLVEEARIKKTFKRMKKWKKEHSFLPRIPAVWLYCSPSEMPSKKTWQKCLQAVQEVEGEEFVNLPFLKQRYYVAAAAFYQENFAEKVLQSGFDGIKQCFNKRDISREIILRLESLNIPEQALEQISSKDDIKLINESELVSDSSFSQVLTSGTSGALKAVLSILEEDNLLETLQGRNGVDEFGEYFSVQKLIDNIVKYNHYENAASIFDLLLKAKVIADENRGEIPRVQCSYNKYHLSVEQFSPDAPFLGDMTDCCQYIGGAGGSCVEYGLSNANSAFLVIRNKKGNVVAQSWMWSTKRASADEGYLILDSFELLGDGESYPSAQKLLTWYIVEMSSRYKGIILGHDGHQNLPNVLALSCENQKINSFDSLPFSIDEQIGLTYTDIKRGFIYCSKDWREQEVVRTANDVAETAEEVEIATEYEDEDEGEDYEN